MEDLTHESRKVEPILGEAIEPRTLAVSKGLNDKILARVFMGLLDYTFDPRYSNDYNANGKVFYTYGDATSIRMYKDWGFKQVADVAPKEKYGVNWRLLTFTPKDLVQWKNDLVNRPTTSSSISNELNAMMDLFNMTDTQPPLQK